ncbi:MAG: 50S ribosomal protein L33 [bacterium]
MAMQCKECGMTGYHTNLNKATTGKLELKKYCKKDKKRTVHTSREKLK